MQSSEDRAYLAGILDGEGSIQRSGNRVCLTVSNTSPELIAWLVEQAGGNVREHPVRPGRKRLWEWRVWRRAEILVILEAVEPYMVVKGDQARAAILELRRRLEVRPAR